MVEIYENTEIVKVDLSNLNLFSFTNSLQDKDRDLFRPVFSSVFDV